MKKIVFCMILFVVFNSRAQYGVITIGPEEPTYYSQWYVINSDEFKNHVFYYDEKKKVDALLTSILTPYNLKRKDGERDEEGDLYWVVDNNNNGFFSTIYLTIVDKEDARLTIVTAPYEEEE